jgi:transposase InsO family protein
MFTCHSSQSLLCAKKHPFQITKAEYKIIKTNLEKEEYKTWSKRAVHSELFKKQLLTISKSTFYKHAKTIIKSKNKSRFRKDKYTPLRGTYINEYWHMDLSYFKTQDGKTHFVHCILDNYSRKIIAWRCEQFISAINVCKLLEEALNAVSSKKIKLISDGGTENFNDKTRQLLQRYNEVNQLKLTHFRALKDIQQSNSMIERFFRGLKYEYLFVTKPLNYKELCMAVKKAIDDYNYVKPHHAKTHLTPHEAYIGHTLPDPKILIKKAQKRRLKKNQNCSCTVCNCM